MTKSKANQLKIGDKTVGLSHPPLVVAEVSGNHNASLDQAKNIIRAAASAGCDAVKLQTYRADTITIDHDGPEFRLNDGLWAGQTLYDLYSLAATPWEWHEELFQLGQDSGLIVFSSPFDETAVDLLQNLDSPAYKISSFELIDLPLIERCAKIGKPLIMSTGMATLSEIEEAVDCAKNTGNEDIILLHCVSGYPTPAQDMNLKTIADLAERFSVNIGLSDHTLEPSVSIAAIALGAVLIEKHFCISRKAGGSDVEFSLEPDEMENLVKNVRTSWEALGNIKYGPTASDQDNLVYRRSLYAVENIKKGHILTKKNIRSIRPGLGLPPKHLFEIIGRMAKTDISRGTPLSWNDIK